MLKGSVTEAINWPDEKCGCLYADVQAVQGTGLQSVETYRVSGVKLANCRWLFETENMDRFLIKWYFYYRKGGKFYMVPQKSRINLARHSKSLSKSDFPFWNYHFFLVLYTVWYDFDRDFECLSRFFSGFLKYHIKFPTFSIIKIPFNQKSIHVFGLK